MSTTAALNSNASQAVQPVSALPEMAVPVLKVMRLQQPELHRPVAGMLGMNSLLTSSLCLPDSFGTIHQGETFKAYLGAINTSKTLMVSRLTVSAQLQTPTQRWHLASSFDAGNQDGGVDVSPGDGVDGIVSHTLDEIGQHILRVEVGYGSSDGTVKTLRKFYRFQVSNPLKIVERIVRAKASTCFVAVTVENLGQDSSGAMTIVAANLEAAEGCIAERVNSTPHLSGTATGTQLFDQCGRLEPGSACRFLFKVQSIDGRAIASGDELGRATFSWRKALGEFGRLSSPVLICPPVSTYLDENDPQGTMTGSNRATAESRGSCRALVADVAKAAATSASEAATGRMVRGNPKTLDKILPVTVEAVDPPESMTLTHTSEVKFRVVNHSPNAVNVQLQFHLSLMVGLTVCGPSFRNLNVLDANGGSAEVSITFLPLSEGLVQLRGCCVTDLVSGQQVPQPPLFNLFVVRPKQ